MNTNRLKEIRERCEKATDGPWTIIRVQGRGQYPVSSYDFPCLIVDPSHRALIPSLSCSDTNFIAHARQDVPDLLRYVDQLKDERKHMIESMASCSGLCGAEWRHEFNV